MSFSLALPLISCLIAWNSLQIYMENSLHFPRSRPCWKGKLNSKLAGSLQKTVLIYSPLICTGSLYFCLPSVQSSNDKSFSELTWPWRKRDCKLKLLFQCR
uniref:Uncharacterized protein n=1 Tax=Micrurus spixii TaxID=129469 RepID=A0A2D4M5F2_9SAUR